MAVMNKNVVHNGKHLVKGSECPKEFLEAMQKQGHVGKDVEEKVEVSLAPKKEGGLQGEADEE
jgi:hypothetical protein